MSLIFNSIAGTVSPIRVQVDFSAAPQVGGAPQSDAYYLYGATL